MVNYLIVRSTYKEDIVSVMTTNNILEHFLQLRDNEPSLRQNLYVALVKDDYNKYNELPKHLLLKDGCNNNFYDIQVLDHLPDNKLVITKQANTSIKFLQMIEKLLKLRYKYDFDNKKIIKEYENDFEGMIEDWELILSDER